MNRALVAYFSWGGNTEAAAQIVSDRTGGDLFRIENVEAYPSGYSETTRIAKQELRENSRPELKAHVENMDRYDTVFLGFPNWWGTIPMAVSSFLESHNLDGKTIRPFCTHGGGGIGRSEADIRKLCPGGRVANGLSISGSRAGSAGDDIDRWLKPY